MPLLEQQVMLALLGLLALSGLFAGVLAGLLGVGGGIVIVPVLYHVFSFLELDPAVRMHLAVGTSLATIIPTSLRSLRAHQGRQSFDGGLFRAWAPGLLVGAIAGAAIATMADFRILVSVFAAVALLVALQMGLGNPLYRLAESPPGRLLTGVLAAGTGILSAMMGIGGGTLAVPLLTLFSVPIHRAVGTAAGLGFIISVPATIGFIIGGLGAAGLPPYSLGYVSLPGVLLIVPTTLLMVPVGARLAHGLSQQGLRRAFALFLGLTSLRMFSDVIGFSS